MIWREQHLNDGGPRRPAKPLSLRVQKFLLVEVLPLSHRRQQVASVNASGRVFFRMASTSTTSCGSPSGKQDLFRLFPLLLGLGDFRTFQPTCCRRADCDNDRDILFRMDAITVVTDQM
jgi:hypothetical protein